MPVEEIVDFRDDRLAGRAGRRLIELVLALHAAYLGLLTTRYAHVPLASAAELMTTVAFATAFAYFFVERRSGIASTGTFLLSFTFLLQTLSSAFIEPAAAFPELLRSPLFAVHTVAAVLGYTGFAASAVSSSAMPFLNALMPFATSPIISETLPRPKSRRTITPTTSQCQMLAPPMVSSTTPKTCQRPFGLNSR